MKSNLSRRNFITSTALASSAAILGTSSVTGEASPQIRSNKAGRSTFANIIRPPDLVTAFAGIKSFQLINSGSTWIGNGVILDVEPNKRSNGNSQLRISLSAENEVSRIHLRWKCQMEWGLRFLGDHWERGYGDLEWRYLVPERIMPWYFLTNDGELTHGYGVKTQPKAMVFWRADETGISLWLDVRNGSRPVGLKGRKLNLCTIITREGKQGESSWQAGRAFCALMSTQPRLTRQPVYGGNNWYYAYGQKCSAKIIERDADLLAELAGANQNRPFQVIDDGWQIAGGTCCGGGPWRYGNAGFPDMPGLAARLKATGVRPGIWMRPLLTHERGTETLALNRPNPTSNRAQRVLDPTISEVRKKIKEDVAGLVAWGYELIKHDFSTFDIFGKWGFAMDAALTEGDWAFADTTKTTAEVIIDVYRAIREGAGENTTIIGCNTIGHLAAGLVELQRTGDDTSGKLWERTRKMGVNTIAFRGIQHDSFFAADADCVGLTNAVPWDLNKQWLDLLARSGTPLFISADPEAVGAEQRKVLREALRLASTDYPLAEPLDWLNTTTPTKWLINGKTVTYDWYGAKGIEIAEFR